METKNKESLENKLLELKKIQNEINLISEDCECLKNYYDFEGDDTFVNSTISFIDNIKDDCLTEINKCKFTLEELDINE